MLVIDATPEKRIFLSIISEYDLNKSICELIDNAIDLWNKKRETNLRIVITLDERQQTITIQDNSGGLEESKLDHLLSPGKTSNETTDNVLGFFGVGSKRAVVALAENITIHTRYQEENTYTIKFDNYWITEEPRWTLPYFLSHTQLPSGTTFIELVKLRVALNSESIDQLKVHLSEVYCKFLEDGVEIVINDDSIKPKSFEANWSFPKNYPPTTFIKELEIDNRKLQVEITSGLLNYPGDPDDSYGVFLYCNDRLITRALTDFSVGFTTGKVGNPHYNISLVRTVVKLKGQSRDMPWDSSKSGINTKHEVFIALQPIIIDASKHYAQVSRSLQGRWQEEVFPFKEGEINTAPLEPVAKIPKSYFPNPPASKKKWHQRILEQNEAIISSKIWTGGLLESIIFADFASKSAFSQRNRISLIVLDSTLEIAYKEYLVNEVKMSKTKFANIAENRADVQKEVANRLPIDAATINKIDFYYKLRCDLIHQRATPNITDPQVEDYRNIVEKILQDMFTLSF